jgi:hypothetical protein
MQPECKSVLRFLWLLLRVERSRLTVQETNARSVALDFSPFLTDTLPPMDIPLLPVCWPTPRPFSILRYSLPCTWLIKHYVMKTHDESGVIAAPFLTSALDGREWSASLPDRFIPGERASVILPLPIHLLGIKLNKLNLGTTTLPLNLNVNFDFFHLISRVVDRGSLQPAPVLGTSQ